MICVTCISLERVFEFLASVECKGCVCTFPSLLVQVWFALFCLLIWSLMPSSGTLEQFFLTELF